MIAPATSGLAISFGAIAGYVSYGVVAVIVVTLVVRLITRIARRRSVRDVLSPIAESGAVQSRAFGFDPASPVASDSVAFGEQRDALGPDPGEEQRR
ncbi:MAG TPA: hypothetical protein VFM95_01050 [Microcella sp.]|nr:hypothetical protein [Microcella sp.]